VDVHPDKKNREIGANRRGAAKLKHLRRLDSGNQYLGFGCNFSDLMQVEKLEFISIEASDRNLHGFGVAPTHNYYR
jgi:hypothetical protein